MTHVLEVALIALASVMFVRPRWRATVAWAALGLTGYAASLSLIQAGPFVRYQHYLAVQDWAGVRLAAVVVVAECLLVLTGVWRAHGRIRESLPPAWRGWRVAALAGMIVLTSAPVSRSPGAFLAELGLAGTIALAHLGAVILSAMAIPPDSATRIGTSAYEWLDGPWGGRAVTWAAIGTTVLAGLLAWFVYERHPHVPDEVAYLLHARYFAAGQLWLPAPVPPEAFDTDLMFTSGGRWFSPVPPGWPAMLAVGVRLGVPWLVNPVFAGLNVALTAQALGAVADRRTGRLGALLLAVSPWHLFLGMSLLTHSFTLTCTLLAVVMVARSRTTGSAGWMLAGGGMTGLVSLIRPLEGLAVAMVLGLWSLTGPTLVTRLLKGAVFTAGAVVVGATTLPYNAAITGSAWRFPLMLYTDTLYGKGSNALGFGPSRGLGWSGLDPFPGHGMIDVVINSNLNIFATGIELLGWGSGSLVVIFALVLSGRLERPDRVLMLPIATIVGLHAAYWFSGGPDFGARYWFLIIVPALGLTARGLLAAARRGPADVGRITVATMALAAGALLVFVPWRATDKYWRYRGMRPDLRAIAADPAFEHGLLLIRGRRHPDWASAVIYNPLRTDGPAPLMAWDRGDSTRTRLLAQFPGRPVWLVDGPSITGGPYRIVAGPLDASHVPAVVDTAAPR